MAAQSEDTKGVVVRTHVFLSSIFNLEKERTGGSLKVPREVLYGAKFS